MRSMQWQLGMLGTVSAFAYRHRETKKNLCRGGRSQDLPSTDRLCRRPLQGFHLIPKSERIHNPEGQILGLYQRASTQTQAAPSRSKFLAILSFTKQATAVMSQSVSALGHWLNGRGYFSTCLTVSSHKSMAVLVHIQPPIQGGKVAGK